MSIHKLTAGSGYDYLTRHVAALDATEKGHTGLASYYTERGETPGVWIGSGLDGIDGLTAGDPVTSEQMRALFGCGLHPLAELRQQQLEGPDLSARDFQNVVRLGAPFRVVDGDVSLFRLEVARRIAAINAAAGLPADAPLPAADRARVRTKVARQFFLAEHGREPVDAQELAGQIAKDSRPRTQTVAGYDLTFSPVKSVSTLWAIAEPAVAALIERAHQAAVKDALAFIEEHALFTRTGPQGIRQVNVRGLVATSFSHRDSRAGDPDLHTHVAVANKVQTLDGRWLSIDGRVLFKANVAASETYNTALEQHLRDMLGVRFAERPGTDPAKRPIREIVGVDRRLNQRWSTRRAHIEVRRGELAIQFQHDHGRPPTPVEALHLAQQATLETRDAKHEPRSLAEQRSTWLNEAAAVLSGRGAVAAMVQTALAPSAETTPLVDARWVSQTASRVLAVMEQSRSTWQMWHVRAEAQRQVRTTDLAAERAAALVDLLVDEVLNRRSVALVAPADNIEEPEALRRVDGSSVYTVAGATLYTSTRILDAEARLVAAAGRHGGASVESTAVDLALLEMAANSTGLDAGQASLVRQMCTSGARLQLAIAPAGAGKTTAMRALTLAWTQDGGQVLGLAPSAAAAAVLGAQTGIRADTLAKLTWSLRHGELPDWAAAVGPSTLVIIDEAGMADTLSLDAAVQFAIDRGASLRLIGDDQQLAAIGAGGVLRDIKHTHGALHLTELHRFTDPDEAAASLALRDGDPKSLNYYLDHDRIHVGDIAKTTEDAFTAWVLDRSAELDAIMVAPTRELVADLNRRARDHRLDHSPASSEVRLADGNQASVGDVIITRANDRRLRPTATDWVKNADRWTITRIGRRGDLTVRHTRSHRTVRLPTDYVGTSTGLGYATTIHAAQGVSADTMHGLLTGQESRQQLYTMLTRGRHANHLYLQVVGDGDPHTVIRPDTISPRTPTETLQQILARDEAPVSASTLLRELNNPAARLFQAVQRYTDGLHVAAEQLVGPQTVAELDQADQYIPGLTTEPAWPTLRARLLALAAETGEHPLRHMLTAASGRDLSRAGDMAAVLYWRLPALTPTNPGPLPWLPGIPETLHSHPVWGAYLAKRSQLVANLAEQVQDHACQGDAPPVRRSPAAVPNTRSASELASRTRPLTRRRAAAQGLWFARYGHGTQPWQPAAESGSIRVKGWGSARPAARVLAALRARHRLRFTVIMCDGGHRSFAPSISPEMTGLEPPRCVCPNMACTIEQIPWVAAAVTPASNPYRRGQIWMTRCDSRGRWDGCAHESKHEVLRRPSPPAKQTLPKTLSPERQRRRAATDCEVRGSVDVC
jgi:conjugative relaxase-like TrwC/TraI family protein